MRAPPIAPLLLAAFLAGCGDRAQEDLLRRGAASLAQGDAERAVRFYGEAVDRRPDDGAARSGLGRALFQRVALAEEDGAVEPAAWAVVARELDRAVAFAADTELVSARHQAHLRWAAGLARTGDTIRALARLEDLVRQAPRRTEARNRLAILLHRRGEPERAEELFLRNAALDSLDPTPWLNLGMLEWSRGRTMIASEHILKASRLAPHDPEILWWVERVAGAER